MSKRPLLETPDAAAAKATRLDNPTVESLSNELHAVKQEVLRLRARQTITEVNVQGIEQKMRGKNIIVLNLEMDNGETQRSLRDKILKIINEIMLEGIDPIKACFVSECHRLGDKGGTPATLMQFSRQSDVGTVLSKGFKLRQFNANRKEQHKKPIIFKEHNEPHKHAQIGFLNKIRGELVEKGFATRGELKVRPGKFKPSLWVRGTVFDYDKLPTEITAITTPYAPRV